MSNPDFISKRQATNLERYGYEHPTQNPEVKRKIVQTNLERYGVENPAMIDEVQNKMKATMLERYGAETAMGVPEFKEKMKATNMRKYGSEYSFGSKEIYQNGVASKFKNGTTMTSYQQKYICDLYKGVLNYPCSNFNLDILVDGIDIEYDGKGHNLSVVLGNISQHDFEVKEIVRDKIVKSSGYKIIRMISHTDKLPSDQVLLEILALSKEYFNSTQHTWVEWYFDENKYRNAEHPEGCFFNFGKLSKLKKELAA